MSRIITFRGQLADGTQERIYLTTRNGQTGYKIVKFQLFPVSLQNEQTTLSIISKIQFTAAPTTVDFGDNRIIAAAAYTQDNSSNVYPEDLNVIFDNEIFNQDIYISMNDTLLAAGEPCNYYIELEQMDLALDEATVATLKDIRNND